MAETTLQLLSDWRAVRFETFELLDSLNDQKLAFTPEGKRWQPLSYQFACIGRTQLVYAWALDKGVMTAADFSAKGLPTITDIKTKKVLIELLEWAEAEWLRAIGSGIEEVKMGRQSLALTAYVYRLAGHERLHHGQIISYFTLAGFALPKQFKQNWAL